MHEIREQVSALIGSVPQSSVRSYLQLNTPALFARTDRGQYTLAGFEAPAASVNPGRCEPAARRVIGGATLVL
ncbi:MAG TPA: hypothetical protein PKD25_05160, partial [Rubrivivax sp.]|nr:hypothetical protein [Rubrivivax sp.]